MPLISCLKPLVVIFSFFLAESLLLSVTGNESSQNSLYFIEVKINHTTALHFNKPNSGGSLAIYAQAHHWFIMKSISSLIHFIHCLL